MLTGYIGPTVGLDESLVSVFVDPESARRSFRRLRERLGEQWSRHVTKPFRPTSSNRTGGAVMMRSRSATPDNGKQRSVEGVVITQRLVAPSPGRASGTFSAVGAVSGQGTVVTDAFVPVPPPSDAPPLFVEGAIRLLAPSGEIVLTIRTVVRSVPDTGVLTGGGTWHVTQAAGEYDGLRAAGSLTVVLLYDDAGAATIDLVLTGRVPSSPPVA